ncbi:hypothetical protein EJ04DRAFT_354324 [Polyplosphaeria fusca]|uniref:DUF7708 domain-containing protein n=1 Tax=Polyplosphaeria fusca TaxID=682080 RepID=A0A9P4V868_9PLEO|nr:hypothetical protein EJ04DRAFT_354324 [Polyplosphaeria fusca]
MDDRSRIRAWYSQTSYKHADDVLKEAYEKAKVSLSETFSTDEIASFGIGQDISLDDVKKTLEESKRKYESKKTSKVHKWLCVLSNKIMYYAPVVDVFAQVQPEYSSVIWGTMKFLMMSVMNHDEMTRRLSKAFASIADLLPKTELSLLLYPTERMVEAIAQLYSSMMAFMMHAVKWYKQGRIAHTWSSIAKPWALEFKDHADAIGDNARRVDELTSAAVKAEMRETRMQILETREQLTASQQQIQQVSDFIKTEFKQLLELALANQSVQNQLRIDVSSSAQMISNVQLGQILTLPFLTALPAPGESLSHCQSLRVHASKGRPVMREQGKLQHWAAMPGSSFLFPRCEYRQGSRDVLLELIEVFKNENSACALLWALRFPGCWDKTVTPTDILRMLVLQALQINPDSLQKGVNPITIPHLRDAASEQDWLALLDRALVGVRRVYLVLDPDLLNHATSQNRYQATKLVELMSRSIRTEVRIIVPSAGIDLEYVRTNWNGDDWMQVRVEDSAQRERALRSTRRARQSRQNQRRGRR